MTTELYEYLKSKTPLAFVDEINKRENVAIVLQAYDYPHRVFTTFDAMYEYIKKQKDIELQEFSFIVVPLDSTKKNTSVWENESYIELQHEENTK